MIPRELQEAIDQLVEGASATSLRQAQEILSQNYREGRGSGDVFEKESQLLAYLVARLPATYAAVYRVLEEVLRHFPCRHFLDLGAGPGTASWAAAELGVKKFTLVEQSGHVIALGKRLIGFSGSAALQQGEWRKQSLAEELPEADIGVLSYVLGEVENEESILEKCWEKVGVLVVIEPGTPRGFRLIRKIREQLIDLGGHLIAPCPHPFVCPMRGNDWCHFFARVERSKLHRFLKEGSLGFEDEKFSYVAAAKSPRESFLGRIVRPPLKQSGHVRLCLCAASGRLEEKTITRSNKELYRTARDAKWGDPL